MSEKEAEIIEVKFPWYEYVIIVHDVADNILVAYALSLEKAKHFAKRVIEDNPKRIDRIYIYKIAKRWWIDGNFKYIFSPEDRRLEDL